MRCRALLHIAIVTVCVRIPLFSFDESVHNRQLAEILFGNQFLVRDAAQNKITPLEKALYLCIDEYNGMTYNNSQAQRYLNDLKRFGVWFLPRLEQFDYTSNSHHQRYTHLGWDWTLYPRNLNGYDFQRIWTLRKERVLLPTIDKVFKFKRNESIKRDSFGALLYYIHIIGDHIGDSKSNNTDRMPLTRRIDYGKDYARNHEENNPSICTELLWHITRLFREQTSSIEYQMLMRYLDRNKNRVFPSGTSMTDAEYNELQAFAWEMFDTLRRYIPFLLQNEDFFIRAFG
jgi:hypothetical protein